MRLRYTYKTDNKFVTVVINSDCDLIQIVTKENNTFLLNFVLIKIKQLMKMQQKLIYY